MNPQETPAEAEPDLPLEIAHILLIDVVGYSKLLLNEQIELLQELNRNRARDRMFSGGGGKREAYPGAHGRRDGSAFFPQPGRASAMCVGD